MIEKVFRLIVLAWMVAHAGCWIVVEAVRLVRSTCIKVKRIIAQDVAEE